MCLCGLLFDARVSLGSYGWLLDMTLNHHYGVVGAIYRMFCSWLGVVVCFLVGAFDDACSFVDFLFSHLGLLLPSSMLLVGMLEWIAYSSIFVLVLCCSGDSCVF
jgi:hypothetical protein